MNNLQSVFPIRVSWISLSAYFLPSTASFPNSDKDLDSPKPLTPCRNINNKKSTRGDEMTS